MADATWLPQWWVPLMYKYEFFDPEMSFDDEVIDMLQKTQAKKTEEAEPQKKLELKEALLLLNKIDVKLNEQYKLTPGGSEGYYASKGGKPMAPEEYDEWSQVIQKAGGSPTDYRDGARGGYMRPKTPQPPRQKFYGPRGSKLPADKIQFPAPFSGDGRGGLPPDEELKKPSPPPELAHSSEFYSGVKGRLPDDKWDLETGEWLPSQKFIDWKERTGRDIKYKDPHGYLAAEKEEYAKSYTSGANREAWIDKLKRKGASDKEASADYEETVLPKILNALEQYAPDTAARGTRAHAGAFGPDSPKSTVGHETGHVVDASQKRLDPPRRPGEASRMIWASGEDENLNLMKQAFPNMRDPRVASPQDTRDEIHADSPAELYANIINLRKNLGRKLTAQDINNLRDHPDEFFDMGAGDIVNSLRKSKEAQTLNDEEIADILNQVAVRQPKAKRGEPTQTIAESRKRRKIRIRLKKRR